MKFSTFILISIASFQISTLSLLRLNGLFEGYLIYHLNRQICKIVFLLPLFKFTTWSARGRNTHMQTNHDSPLYICRWQCPIHNDTLKRFAYESDSIFKFLKPLFSIVFSPQKWLAQFYCRKTYSMLTELNIFKTRKRQYLSHFYHIKVVKV